MKQFKTEQEQFWAGKFGDSYVDRNMDKKFLAANISLWSNIFLHICELFFVVRL